MQKLTPEYIESLIDKEEYNFTLTDITCKLIVGEAVFVGVAHCFDATQRDVPRGRISARRKAVDQIFEAEAYHLKRERDALNIKYGIKHLPIYTVVKNANSILRLIGVAEFENGQASKSYLFQLIDHLGDVSETTIFVPTDCDQVYMELQRQLDERIVFMDVAREGVTEKSLCFQNPTLLVEVEKVDGKARVVNITKSV